MKTLIVFVLFSVAVVQVRTARLYDEKENAIKEIDAKFAEVNSTKANILQAITNERNSPTNKSEADALKYVETKTAEARTHLDKEVTAVIRTAIVKAKPISVIHCIRNTAAKISENITRLENALREDVLLIKKNKTRKIELDEYSVNAIIAGLKELLDQAKTKIKEGAVIALVKKEALGNCDSAMILLGDIEIQVHEPILSILYIKVRQDIDRKHREFKIKVENAFAHCVK